MTTTKQAPLSAIPYDQAWLGEIAARLGVQPRVHAGPVLFIARDGACLRECWVWFPAPDLKNHNLSLDQYPDHWQIGVNGFAPCGHAATADVRWPGSAPPPAHVIRSALVTGGLLGDGSDAL